jgi:hypothetical protein
MIVPKRKRDHLLLVALALCLLIPATYLACRKAPPPPPAGAGVKTATELHKLLASRGLALTAVPGSRTGENADLALFLCEGERTWEELSWLNPRPDLAEKWKGVVLARPAKGLPREGPDGTDGWGETGLVVGEVALFGDPALIARVRKALAE